MKKRAAVVVTFVIGLYYFLEFLLPPFLGGDFASLSMTSPCLVETDGGYRLYMRGIRALKKEGEQRLGLGVAESKDASSWSKYSGNPLLARSLFSSKDWGGPDNPAVVREPDGSYTMFYVGHGADATDRVMRTMSKDGLAWHGRTVVLSLVSKEAEATGKLERASIKALAVLRGPDGYVAYLGATYRRGKRVIRGVSRATSRDGTQWELDEQNNPVLPIEPERGWDYKEITDLSVVQADGELRLYYAGTGVFLHKGGTVAEPMTLVGLATSADGIAWERHEANPVFGPAAFRFFSTLRRNPGVAAALRRVHEVNRTRSGARRVAPWLGAVTQLLTELRTGPAAGQATRVITAGTEPVPVLERFDALSLSGISVTRRGGQYLLAYGGAKTFRGGDYQIGLATSADGISWVTTADQPALTLGTRPQSTYLADVKVTLSTVFIVVGTMALGLGLFGLVKLHGGRVAKREKDWAYSLGFFIALVFTLVVAAAWGKENPETETAGYKLYNIIYKGLLVSFGASSMGLLTFYLASASYRSFKLKNAEAGLMMVAAILVMLGQVPLGQLLTAWLPDNLAPLRIENITLRMSYAIVIPAMRAIQIGAAAGGLVLATRLWLSMDKRRD